MISSHILDTHLGKPATDVVIQLFDAQGQLIGESKTNISAARVRTLPNQTAEIEVTIDVRDTQHLTTVMNKIANYSDVISIFRVFGRTAGR